MIDIAITRRTLEEFNLSKDELEEFKQIVSSVSAVVKYRGLCQGQNPLYANCRECAYRNLCGFGLAWTVPDLRLRSGPRRAKGPVQAHRGPTFPMTAQQRWATEGCS